MHASHAAPAPDSNPLAIVCSLDAVGVADRMAEFEQLFATALVSYERQPAKLRLVLAVPEQGEVALRDLFSREADCCQFFSFAIQRDEQTLVVKMAVPEGAEPMLDDFERLAAGALRAMSR
jgi:hypothetical protein